MALFCGLAALAALALSAEGLSIVGRGEVPSLPSVQQHQSDISFVRSLDFKRTLRICNAYPLETALDIFFGDGDVKLTTSPMAYKGCGDFTPRLHTGDRVDFKIENTNVGTFTIGDLPNGDAVLLLVIYRHDHISTAVTFESHVFSASSTAQIAVLDTYKAKQLSPSKVYIQDETPVTQKTGTAPRNEVLRFNSVVALDPGAYQVMLSWVGATVPKVKDEFVALPKEDYVIIRVGVEAEEGDAYSEELMIFPQSAKSALGGAFRMLAPGSAFLVMFFSGLLNM